MTNEILALNRPYIDDEARANLRSFISAQDRARPPIFVGREEIIRKIEDDVAECRSNTDETACFTRVIHGAPGAGKTSLLTEIRHRLSGEKGSVGPLTVVPLARDKLSEKPSVAVEFINAYRGSPLNIRKNGISTTTFKFGFKGTGGEHRSGTAANTIEEQMQSFGGLWSTILKNTSVDREENVFLLLVDESQNTMGDKSNLSGTNSIVTNLHAGFLETNGLKIVPVFAGLSDTESVLADRGISRLPRSSSIHLGALTQDETEELVSKWMRHDEFGFEDLFSDADIRRVSQMIAVASEGWPRHANGYLAELARSVLEHGDGDELTIDLNEVFERGHDDRLAYYQKRLTTAKLGGYARAIRDAAQRSTNGIVELATLHTIAEEIYQIPRSELFALHDTALHAGVLEPATDGDEERFKFPIPSFFTYMHLGEDPAKFNAKMREQLIEHSHLWSESTDGVPH